MDAPVDCTATCAAPTMSAPTPYSFDSLIRTRLPPTLIGMICRSVWLSNDRDPAPNAEPFGIGGTPHVATHFGPPKSAVAVSAVCALTDVRLATPMRSPAAARVSHPNLFMTTASCVVHLMAPGVCIRPPRPW